MALLSLRFYPDEVLRKRCEPVTAFGPELARFVEDLFETMYAENGIGLASNQVGVSQRVLVMDVPSERPPGSKEPLVPNRRALINPEILSKTGQQSYDEGCLSFPTLSASVKRAQEVKVRFQRVDGAWEEATFTGLESVCFQHEHDHLEGITFVDYLSPLKRRLLLRDLRKFLSERGIEPAPANA